MSRNLSTVFQSLFLDLSRVVPLNITKLLFRAVGALYYTFNPDEKMSIEENIKDLLAVDERVALVQREVFSHISEHYFEKILIANRPATYVQRFVRDRVRCEGLATLDTALARGHGVIAVTTHWGAVELIPATLFEHGYPVSVILEAKTLRLRRALERLVQNTNVELIIASRGDRVLDKALDALARGRVLMTQADEVDAWQKKRSKTIKVFDKTLYFDRTLDIIAKRSGAAAVGVCCRRNNNMHYTLRCEEIAIDPLTTNVAEVAFRFWEKLILEAPEQWYQWKKWNEMKAPLLGEFQ